MPNKRATGSRSTVIRCPNCGEDYSVTYKRCPFCEEKASAKSGSAMKTTAGTSRSNMRATRNPPPAGAAASVWRAVPRRRGQGGKLDAPASRRHCDLTGHPSPPRSGSWPLRLSRW